MPKLKISEILHASIEKRVNYVRHGRLEAYRLLDVHETDLPLAIDIYKDNAVLHLYGKINDKTRIELESALEKLLHIRSFFYKNRSGENIKLPKVQPKKIVIEEYSHKFLINLSDYQDTGLFLDHRETRKWIASQCKNKTVLNTFAYTGSFSVYAAKAGAQKTFSVDLSKTYCDWIRENFQLNQINLERNWIYKMDTLEFFSYAMRKSFSFDIIIIDPPTFSRNKGKSFSVEKDHPVLINTALKLLKPGGFILFSNNRQDFRLNKEKLLRCKVRNFQLETIPSDFTNLKTHYCFLIHPA